MSVKFWVNQRKEFIKVINKYSRLLINGSEGTYVVGSQGTKINKGLSMNAFGDCVGICLHHQTADEIADEIADVELQKGSKKKKEEIAKTMKKDLNL